MNADPGPAAPAPEALALDLRGVGRTTPGGAHILVDVSLRLPRGGVLNVVGPSGAGKSSLLRLLNRLDEPTAGHVGVLGREVREWPVRALRRRVGLVFQTPSLLGLTVAENLALPFHLHGEAPPDLEQRTGTALRQAGLDAEFLPRREDGLSLGQRQRVALARALIGEPDMLVLDEPTASLDPRTAEALLSQLAHLNAEQGLTLVVATHRLQEMDVLGGAIAVIIGGRLEASGPLADVLAHPPSEAAGAFLHGESHEAHDGPKEAP